MVANASIGNVLLFVVAFLVIAGLFIEWVDMKKDADLLVRGAVAATTETAVA